MTDVGVHSTAQLCHRVASTLHLPVFLLVVRAVVQEALGLCRAGSPISMKSISPPSGPFSASGHRSSTAW